ncbi:unnamed protein product [Owenia fusiformis]|uniref:Uncharacterized protein n=1 Tax=Owenia fusiformis TaxID=6347 RepID=A0A8J1XJE9_OWEFU|nr:unnamed protein product [Owenia fusiformis]
MESIVVTHFVAGFIILGVFFTGQAQSNYFKIAGFGRRVSGTATERFFDVVQTTECVLRCIRTIGCLSLNYNPITLECLVYTVDGLEKYDDADWIYGYAKRSTWGGAGVFHVRGQGGTYTIPDPTVAESVCTNNYNAKSLATRDQLAEMIPNGFHVCACGWIADGSSVIPLNYTHSACGNSVGVNTCISSGGSLLTWGADGQNAYCYTDF